MSSKKLVSAMAEYQREMELLFAPHEEARALEEFARAKQAYQHEVAMEVKEKQATPQITLAEPAIEKVRSKFPQASGAMSPNGFSMSFASGQVDSAIVAFRKAQGRYPTKAEGRQIITMLNTFSIKAMPQDRLLEHLRWWQDPDKGGRHKKGQLYLD